LGSSVLLVCEHVGSFACLLAVGPPVMSATGHQRKPSMVGSEDRSATESGHCGNARDVRLWANCGSHRFRPL